MNKLQKIREIVQDYDLQEGALALIEELEDVLNEDEEPKTLRIENCVSVIFCNDGVVFVSNSDQTRQLFLEPADNMRVSRSRGEGILLEVDYA